MASHDAGYKRLFSNPRLVADLLVGFVREPWVQQLDLGTLERVNASYVSDDLREREDDLVWRVRWRDGWLYVYLLLEFQSTVDRFMALRLAVYVCLLYQDLVRKQQLTPSGLLPPVLPLVLYNGERKWTAPQELTGLIESAPGGLSNYQPRLRYLLLEERAYTEEELAPQRNLAAALFRLENSRDVEAITRVLTALLDWLDQPEHADIRRDFTAWLQQVLLPRRVSHATVPELGDLREVKSMLAERVKEWTKEWWEQGVREGQHKGQTALLMRQLERKFGPLEVTDRRRVAEADAEQLLVWGDRILTAKRLEDVFE